MDGVPFGRKVDLKTNDSYEKLYPALEEMFQQFISGHYCGSHASSNVESDFVQPSRKLDFLDGSEYVLIYEDHEGDFMLVGDVPWDLFISTVKRLRIMKGSEQVNLAPRNADAMKSQVAGG
jgi:auxin-responsive protein IAA